MRTDNDQVSVMQPTVQLPIAEWEKTPARDSQDMALTALEDGKVLFFPQLAFTLTGAETRFLTPDLVADSKNVSYDFATRKIGHCACPEADKPAVAEMMHRFCGQAKALVENLLAAYKASLTMGRASLRPVEAAGRTQAWRKDDTRLHVDSFPTTPLNGKRILRVFSNVNPAGRPRTWRLGEAFGQVAARFAAAVRPPAPGSLMFMQLFRITRGRRSLYDHYMLGLHDAMKADENYQRTCPQSNFDFPASSTWAVFTDSVPHAVTAGQHQFEQTFYLDVGGMAQPEKSPLRILEKQLGKTLRS
jgi:3-deoxy-D-manno-oct-2-ulosonic acid (Kdo) hydroxylase